VASFRDLSDASKINRAPQRLALVKANGTDSLQAILKKAGLPDKAWPQFAVMNGLELSAVPAAGRLIKTVR
jgi:predicted Zn-dependent protease